MKRRRHQLARIALVSAGLLLVGACGGEAAQPESGENHMSPGQSDSSGGGGSEIHASLDILGHALTNALGTGTYDVAGTTLRLSFPGDFDQYMSTECSIVQLTAGSLTLPADSAVELEYGDGHVEICDL